MAGGAWRLVDKGSWLELQRERQVWTAACSGVFMGRVKVPGGSVWHYRFVRDNKGVPLVCIVQDISRTYIPSSDDGNGIIESTVASVMDNPINDDRGRQAAFDAITRKHVPLWQRHRVRLLFWYGTGEACSQELFEFGVKWRGWRITTPFEKRSQVPRDRWVDCLGALELRHVDRSD